METDTNSNCSSCYGESVTVALFNDYLNTYLTLKNINSKLRYDLGISNIISIQSKKFPISYHRYNVLYSGSRSTRSFNDLSLLIDFYKDQNKRFTNELMIKSFKSISLN